MPMFQMIVARESYVDAVRAKLAKGVYRNVPVANSAEKAIDEALEIFQDDLRWRDDSLNVDTKSAEYYEIENYDEKKDEYVLIGWEITAEGYYDFPVL